MGANYEDWADWAGDHPEQAEAELRRLLAKSRPIVQIGEAAYYEVEECEHAEVNNQGVCENCATEVEGWEPDDTQLLHQFGTKEPAA